MRKTYDDMILLYHCNPLYISVILIIFIMLLESYYHFYRFVYFYRITYHYCNIFIESVINQQEKTRPRENLAAEQRVQYNTIQRKAKII